MQAPLQSPECSHIGDSESSSRLNTSVNPWREQLQIDPHRPHEDGKTIRPKQHVQHPDQNEDEAEEPSQRGLQQIWSSLFIDQQSGCGAETHRISGAAINQLMAIANALGVVLTKTAAKESRPESRTRNPVPTASFFILEVESDGPPPSAPDHESAPCVSSVNHEWPFRRERLLGRSPGRFRVRTTIRGFAA
jgi:hypothetical protein